ncbi:PREDICTED: lymphocyte antigen 6K-like [Chrysochloris asiatica]|uniref:Lymphocyte antigen 6K-like n=1 Tax=Chrysochloris asiatica TaxID=185453 RepID=A0A9B0SX93_CHRAS|nr:PREDICTED: lymphocyte antigen 6K-like [Chrysochloris asiatica]
MGSGGQSQDDSAHHSGGLKPRPPPCGQAAVSCWRIFQKKPSAPGRGQCGAQQIRVGGLVKRTKPESTTASVGTEGPVRTEWGWVIGVEWGVCGTELRGALAARGRTESMALLLILVLFLDLAKSETNVTISERQNALNCHVCERENTFVCTNPVKCENADRYCVVAATKIFARFFIMSKQCSQYCPVVEMPAPSLQRFILLKPTAFLYAKCCEDSLCNEYGPEINETAFREMVESSSTTQGSRAGLAMCLMLASVVLSLSLS